MITSEKLKEILEKNYGIKTAKIDHHSDALIIDKHESLRDIKEYRQGFSKSKMQIHKLFLHG